MVTGNWGGTWRVAIVWVGVIRVRRCVKVVLTGRRGVTWSPMRGSVPVRSRRVWAQPWQLVVVLPTPTRDLLRMPARLKPTAPEGQLPRFSTTRLTAQDTR